MIPELRDLSYESRLLQCGLTTLETRWLRGDQIEVLNCQMIVLMLVVWICLKIELTDIW